MKVAFVIYDGMTALDFIGVYDPVTRLKTMGFMKDLQWDICAHTKKVKDITGLRLSPTRIRQSLQGYDMVIVLGGFGSRKLMNDKSFIEWLKTAEPAN